MWVCISNTSNRKELVVGKYYDIFKHEHTELFNVIYKILEIKDLGEIYKLIRF